MLRLKTVFAVVGMILVGWSVVARGTLVDLQILDTTPGGVPPSVGGNYPLGTMSGAAAIGSAGDVWNVQDLGAGPGFTTGSLNTTSGLPTNTYVTLTNAVGSYDEGTFTPSSAAFPLLTSYAVSAGTMTGAIHGLVPGDSYTLYMYGTNGQNGTGGGDFTIDSVSHSTYSTNALPPYTGDDVVTFTSVIASSGAGGDGFIDFTVAPVTAKFGTATIFNGLQIQGTIVPEPSSSLGIATIASLALLTQKRRRFA